jgi:hypothetical protein
MYKQNVMMTGELHNLILVQKVSDSNEAFASRKVTGVIC